MRHQLGIFVDPCLRNGLPAAYRATFHPASVPSPVGEVPVRDQGAVREVSHATLRPDNSQTMAQFLDETPVPAFEFSPRQSPYGDQSILRSLHDDGLEATFGARSGLGAEKQIGLEKGEGDVERISEDGKSVEAQSARGSGPASISADELARIELDIAFLPQSAYLPVSQIPSCTSMPVPTARVEARGDQQQPPPSRPSLHADRWVDPFAAVYAARPDAPLRRHSSDLHLGAAAQRRAELQAAAERLYERMQAQL